MDLKNDGDEVIIAKGGRGGRGNAKFKNSVRQAPTFAEPVSYTHLDVYKRQEMARLT